MRDSGPQSLISAIKLASSILEAFRESSLYGDYKAVDGWTDNQYEMALDALNEAVANEELLEHPYIVVGTVEPNLGKSVH